MNKLFFGLLFLIVTTANAQNWQLIWFDEFNTPGQPDVTKWSFDTEGNNWDWGNAEAQNYTSADKNNAWVENGNLIIEARKEQYTWPGDNQIRDYTSARLMSKGKGDWLYGKLEIRAKLPTGKGMWPGIWMLPTTSVYGGWPKSGELDIMENVGYDPERLHFNIHTESYNHTIGTNKGYNTLFNQPYNNYMIYELQWFPDSVVFYVDHVKYFKFARESADYKVWPFNQQFHLLMNIAVGGSWGGLQGIDDAIFPQKMYVDYVRVYQQSSNDKYVVNATSTGGGYIDKSPVQDSVTMNSKVTLTATPDKNHQFAFWAGDVLSKENPYVHTVTANANIEGVFKHWCESVNNGDFSHGFSFWEYIINDGGTGNLSVANGELLFNVDVAGVNAWSNTLAQQGFLIENGKQYFFSFDAKATANRTIKAGVGMNHDPWTTYIYQTLNLTTSMQHFSYSFTMAQATDAIARMIFDMGTNASDVTFDNISLSCTDLTTGIQTQQTNKADFTFSQFNEIVQINLLNQITNDEMNISLIDMSGRLVKSIDVKQNTNQFLLPVADVSKGMYIISVKSNADVMNKKISLK